MNRIDERFAELRRRGEKALMPYICAGDPDLESTYAVVRELERQGADLLELGIPFSDPIADGPAIQAASQRALAAGTTPEAVLALVRRLRQDGCRLPLLLMTYANIVYRPGMARFTAEAAAAGADGLIVPDLPMEEEGDLRRQCREQGLHLIGMLAPTSTEDRIAAACAGGSGFLYLVSLTGVTGARDVLSERFVPLVMRARQATQLPLCVGFGVSTPEQARRVADVADGVIVGSALVRLMGEGYGRSELVRRLGESVAALKAATRSA